MIDDDDAHIQRFGRHMFAAGFGLGVLVGWLTRFL
jgi:hypothetical protein